MTETDSNSQCMLLVEDDPDQRAIVLAVYGGEWSIVECANCAEARVQLARRAFDLILLDVGLPDGSGSDLLAELRQADELSANHDTPVVMVTASDDANDYESSFDFDARFVKKPLQLGDLQSAVSASIPPRS